MSKSVVLVLESSYEQDYGEYANIPVFNAHGEIIGWTGGEVPECGHPCEFNALNEEGFTSCASSATVNRLRAENAKLRDERVRYEDLARILNREWGIEVSWDGLRRFWYVGLTETGMKERDALKAENDMLRACLGDCCADCAIGMGKYADSLCDPLKAENAKLRELVRDMHRWMGRAVYDGSVREFEYRDFGLVLRELGIDADDEDGYEVKDD